jgi:hypothetical protein
MSDSSEDSDDIDCEPVEENEEISEFLSQVQDPSFASDKEPDNNGTRGQVEVEDGPPALSFGTKCFCGALSAGILASIFAWNETLGLDILTMVLSLASIVYVWTNG